MHPQQIYNPSLVRLLLIFAAVLVGLLIVYLVTGAVCKLTENRPRVYDWQQDPTTVQDLDTSHEREIRQAWDAFAAARDACRGELRARASLYGAGQPDVIALPAPVHNDTRPAA